MFSFFISSSVRHRDLHSFPTRRSSDLDFQANRRSKGRFVRWHFLFGRNRKGNQNQQKKDTPDLHISLRIRFCLLDRKSTRLNSSHTVISYAVFCLKKKKKKMKNNIRTA